jgi:hypothetical protein
MLDTPPRHAAARSDGALPRDCRLPARRHYAAAFATPAERHLITPPFSLMPRIICFVSIF